MSTTAPAPERERTWASHSSLTLHRKCPQAWHYRSLQRLEPNWPDPAVERDFGSWWHMLRAADSIERGRAHESLKWMPETLTSVDDGPTLPAAEALVMEVMDLAVEWWDGQSQTYQAAFTERIGADLPKRLRSVDTRWRARWKPDITAERPLAVELRWERELPVLKGPNGSVADPQATLVGYVDEVYLDTRRNAVVVRDHKAHKALSTQTVADDMMDSQLQLYAWGASPTITSWGVGPIRATGYDRVRMKAPTTPVVTQMGSLSKTVVDFDLSTYEAWCASKPAFPGRKADGSQAGVYAKEEAVVERLSTPAARSIWQQRTLTPLNVNIVRAHLRAAVDSAVDMATSYERVQVEGEAARNLTTGCRWCDFASLCRAQMVGGVEGEYVLSDHNLRVGKPRVRS